jgi:hypothetical protein
VLVLGLDLAVARTMRVVGRPGVRVVTVAVYHSDTIVPEPVKELHSIGSMPPAPLHSASYYAAAFPFLIGDSGAPEDRDSINRAVVAADSLSRLIPEGDCRAMLVESVVRVDVAAVVVPE